MELFKRLVNSIQRKQKIKKEEHSIIVHFNYLTDNLEELHNLKAKLEKVIHEKKVGEYDGHEIATDYSDGFLYMYGPNAEELFKTIKPVLEDTNFIKGAKVKLLFGELDSGAKEIELEIGSD
jgi:hypothetical protein